MSSKNSPVSGYSTDAYQYMIHDNFNVLRARLYNFIESITEDKKQAESRKGLIKDFTGQAYHDTLREVEKFLIDKQVLSDSRGNIPPSLNGQSIQEFIV
jgi:hypothetical protein